MLDLATLPKQGLRFPELMLMNVPMSLYDPVAVLNRYPKVFAGTIVSERGRFTPDKSIKGNCILYGTGVQPPPSPGSQIRTRTSRMQPASYWLATQLA